MLRFYFIFAAFLCLATANLFAQKDQPIWSNTSENQLVTKGERRIVPTNYRLLKLNISSLTNLLEKVPKRFSDEEKPTSVLLNFPMPNNGEDKIFQIYEVETMTETLSQKFPTIKSYLGVNVKNSAERMRFDWTTHGFHAMMRFSDQGTVFIDPYSTKDQEHYICYYAKDHHKTTEHQCFTDAGRHHINPKKDIQNNNKSFVLDGTLYRYQLALAATSEYTAYHGGTVSDAMSEMVTAINRVNEVMEVDVGVTLQMIDNNDQLIYTPNQSDPYTNGNLNVLLNQNESNLNSVIGEDNYDIGHVFCTANGGLAWVKAICTYAKARAATGLYNPTTDQFYIEYVSHEVAHQLGANHVFNSSCENNSYASSAVEPGSGSSLMSYAGVCNPNVEYVKDPYLNGFNVNEIDDNLLTGWGVTCAVALSTSNIRPQVEAGPDYIVPANTPFVLTGAATDGNGDNLSYCWEQVNPEYSTQPPSTYSYNGPNMRSLQPQNVDFRSFPSLAELSVDNTPTWEVLSSVQRTMDFQLTVRDNNYQGGLTHSDRMQLTTTTSAGPFYITNLNSGQNWSIGENQTIEWNVANTNQDPIFCSHVRIELSVDGGLTYPYLLAENTPNDGSHMISVPNITTSTGRVRIAAINHIFFDISDVNLSISNPGPTFSLQAPTDLSTCNGNNVSCNIQTNNYGSFSNAITLSATGGPANVSFNFSNNNFVPNNNETALSINLPPNVGVGTYPIYIAAAGGATNQEHCIELKVVNPSQSVSASQPMAGASNVNIQPNFTWTTVVAEHYELEISQDPNFSILAYSQSTAYPFHTTQQELNPFTTYYWRVASVNACGSANYSQVRDFETGFTEYCTSFGEINSYDWIEAIQVGDFSNTSGGDFGYGDFTNMTGIDLTVGTSNNLVLTPGNQPVEYPEYWKIWIDFDKDGVLNDGNELVYDAGAAYYGPVNGNLYIPPNASVGSTLMRVSMKWNTAANACEEFGYGEVEDYRVNILNPSACTDSDEDGICDESDICFGGNDNIDVNNNAIPDDCEPVNVSLKVFLEGCYYPGGDFDMEPFLREADLIPTSHEYTGAPYYAPAQSISQIPETMIDWVVVDVRTGPNPQDRIERRAALLLANGNVVDFDGVSPLSFDLPPTGNYYFVVRHRNHMDVMTPTSLQRSLNMEHDFTTGILQAFGNNSQKMKEGKAVMVGGDMDQNQVIQVTDYDLWFVNPALFHVYHPIDITLDGVIQVTDYDLWFVNSSKLNPPELGY